MVILPTGGAFYIRWGRKDCPVVNGTNLVYSGNIQYLSSVTYCECNYVTHLLDIISFIYLNRTVISKEAN